MNREYNSRVSSKNSELLLKNLKNTTGDYFFAAPCISFQSCSMGARHGPSPWQSIWTP